MFPVKDGQIEDPFRYCKKITTDSATNFYWAIVSLPSKKRKAVYAIYAFARRCDDIADGEYSKKEKQKSLNELKEQVNKTYQGEPEGKLYEALRIVIDRFEIPKKYFLQLIEGVEMDLSKNRYETFRELRTYCYHVASVVGLILIHIFEYDSKEAEKRGIDLGLGMQMTNIIRDIDEDLERDRIYLPLEDMQRFNYSEEDLKNKKFNENLKSLIKFETNRAEIFFSSGEKLFRYLPGRTRICPAGLYGIYFKLLQEMKSERYNPFSDRPQLTTSAKIRAVLSQWLPTMM